MKFEWIDNDTIALGGLVLIATCGLFTGYETIVSATVGAIGGFIGSKLMNNL